MSTPDGKKDYDPRKYTSCAPWWGRRGAPYTRRFRPQFIGALHSYADKFSTLYDHYTLTDPGAQLPDGNMIPHPGNPNTTLRQESELAYAARSKKLYSLIWLHVEDIDIRGHLSTVAGNGLAALVIIDQFGHLPDTGLTKVNQEISWTNLKMADVGQTEDTIVRFHGHMSRVNDERAVPYDEETRRINFYHALSGLHCCGTRPHQNYKDHLTCVPAISTSDHLVSCMRV